MKIALVDSRIDNLAKIALLKEGFYIIETTPSQKLPEATSGHSDMLLFRDGNKIISSAEYCEAAPYIFEDISRLVPNVSLSFTDDSFSKEYPHDALFNALVIGKRLFAKTDSVSRAVIAYAEEKGYGIIHVKQGYPACTVLPLGDSAAITADEGMAKVMSENGIKVSLIRNGNISLPPYDYGFIGGAAGVFRDKVYFIGSYETHPDASIIENAVKEAGFTPVSLSPAPLADLGRIVFFEGNV